MNPLIHLVITLLTPAAGIVKRSVEGGRLAALAEMFGSDILNRYTYRYTWIANQFGHTAIGWVLVGAAIAVWLIAAGFVRSLLWVWRSLLDGATGPDIGFVCPPAVSALCEPQIWLVETDGRFLVLGLALIFWSLYVVKEVTDVLMALDPRDTGPPRPTNAFAIGRDELIDDGLADAGFVLFGIATAWMVVYVGAAGMRDGTDLIAGPVLAVGLALLLAPYAQRMLRRMALFDRSALPTYARLAQFDGALTALRPGSPGTTEPGTVLGALLQNPWTRPPLVFVVANPAGEVLRIGAEQEESAPKPIRGRTLLLCSLGSELVMHDVAIRFTNGRASFGPHPADELDDIAGVLKIDNGRQDARSRYRILLVDDLDWSAAEADLRRVPDFPTLSFVVVVSSHPSAAREAIEARADVLAATHDLYLLQLDASPRAGKRA